MLYGSGYDSIASQEINRDQARDQRYFQSIAARRQVEQMMAAQREAALARRQRAMEFASNMGMQRMSMDRQDRSLNTNRNDRLFDSMLENRRFYDKLAADTSDDRARRSDVEFRTASEAVMEGAIRGSDVDKLFPTLSDTHRNRLKALSRSVEEFEGEEVTASQSAADSANSQIKLATMAKREGLQKQIDELDASLKKSTSGLNRPRWLMGPGTDTTLQREAAAKMLALTGGKPMSDVNLGPAELQALLQQIMKNRSIAEMATFDEGTQGFVPAFRRPGQSPIKPMSAPAVMPAMMAGAQPTLPVQPTIGRDTVSSGEMFNNEAAARAAGFGTGAIIHIFDPATGKYRRARLK